MCEPLAQQGAEFGERRETGTSTVKVLDPVRLADLAEWLGT